MASISNFKLNSDYGALREQQVLEIEETVPAGTVLPLGKKKFREKLYTVKPGIHFVKQVVTTSEMSGLTQPINYYYYNVAYYYNSSSKNNFVHATVTQENNNTIAFRLYTDSSNSTSSVTLPRPLTVKATIHIYTSPFAE